MTKITTPLLDDYLQRSQQDHKMSDDKNDNPTKMMTGPLEDNKTKG